MKVSFGQTDTQAIVGLIVELSADVAQSLAPFLTEVQPAEELVNHIVAEWTEDHQSDLAYTMAEDELEDSIAATTGRSLDRVRSFLIVRHLSSCSMAFRDTAVAYFLESKADPDRVAEMIDKHQ